MTHVEQNGRDKLLKQRSGGYKPLLHTWGTHERDLPPFTFRTVQAMLLDPAVRLGLAMRAAPIYGVEFARKEGDQWVPGITAESEEVGTFVLRQLRRIWDQVEHILSAQIWGWSAGEVTYRLKDGLVEIDRLLPRHSNDTLIRVDSGEPIGVQVRRVANIPGGAVDLHFPKCWWHSYEPEPGMFYGRPAMLGSYSPWWDKWMNGGALDVRRLFMHKDAYGGNDITYPEGTTYIPDKGEVPNRDVAREIAEQLIAGGVTARPAAYDERGNELWQLSRATVPATPTHILQYPKDLDVEIWRGMSIADDVLSSEDSGAWAGKRVPMAAFYASLDRWVLRIIHDIVTQILEPLVELNFGRAVSFEVTHKPLAEQAMEQQGATQGQGQQPAGQGQAAGPPVQRMGLDPVKAVGQGVLSAAELVKAARSVMRQRMAWAPHQGDRGGRGWKNTETGEIRYQDEKPDDNEDPQWEHRATHEDIESLLTDLRDNPSEASKSNTVLSPVTDEQARTISSVLGIDVTGYAHYIDGSHVSHILQQHGDETRRGQENITEADILMLPSIVSNPDEVVYVGKTKTGLDGIRIKKRINGTVFVIEEVRGKKRLSVTTMYKT